MPIQTKEECNHFITTLRQTMMIADISDDDLLIARLRLYLVIKPPHLKLKDVMSLAMLDTEKLKNPKLVNEVITQNVGYEVDQLIKGDVKLDVAVGKQCLVLQNEVFIQRNSCRFYGFLGDRGHGQWGLVGEGRIEYPDGQKDYGTWADRGIGRWGFVGEGRMECSNGQKEYGTWGDKGNGKWGLVGEGRIEHLWGRAYYGTWGDHGNGKWGLIGEGRIECSDGQKDYGTWGDKGNGQWGFVGEGRQEFSNGKVHYGTWDFTNCGINYFTSKHI